MQEGEAEAQLPSKISNRLRISNYSHNLMTICNLGSDRSRKRLRLKVGRTARIAHVCIAHAHVRFC